MKIFAVILSGGVGARLWPVSRELRPKPFMRLLDGETLLQKTFRRAASLPGVSEIVTVTNEELYFMTVDDYAGANSAGLQTSFILEPFSRNTAAAVAIAASAIAQRHGDNAIMLVLPADHLISLEEQFVEAVHRAAQLAADNYLVTFGIKPTAPETGYGYIEFDGHTVLRFVEKPSRERAEQYLESGNYLWNAGMFCFRAGALLQEMQAHAPAVMASVRECMDAGLPEQGPLRLDPQCFAQVPDISIDYALMERSARVAVVPCDIGWSDIGSWTALSAMTPADEYGNTAIGEVLWSDAENCHVQSEDRVIGVVGARGLVIVDTPDALLVADRHRVQDVKAIVAQLKERKHEAHRIHTVVHRPWGTYSVLSDGPHCKVKRLEVKPGAALSLQMHHHRSEHWIVVSGTAHATNGSELLVLHANDSTIIPLGQQHRLENKGDAPLVIIEVQTGGYLGEDDIVRFDDRYGRG
jgi:mannose-1-phosphate guanylyltransferase